MIFFSLPMTPSSVASSAGACPAPSAQNCARLAVPNTSLCANPDPSRERGEPGRFYYSRYDSPTVAEAEAQLGQLDGGHALLFPSGSGATTALVLALLHPGDTIALAEGAYYGTGVTFQALAKWGLRYVEFDQTGTPPEGVQLLWLEAPSNPFLTMPDLEAAAAHAAPVVVDSTAATPVYLRPLEHDADFVLHSATKYLAGHDDALLGAVVCRET